MQYNLYLSDVHNAQASRVYVQVTANRNLWEGDAIIASFPPQARIARGLIRFATAEECLEGKVNADGNVLERLRLHTCQREPFGFEGRQGRLLVIEAYRLLLFLPRLLALGKEVIVEPAALLKLLFQETLLLFVRVQTVLERLTYALILP